MIPTRVSRLHSPPHRLCRVWLGVILFLASGLCAAPLDVVSPSGQIQARIDTDAQGRLTWAARRDGVCVVEASALGIAVGGLDLGQGVELGKPKARMIRETFAWRGGKSRATNHCRAVSLPVRHLASQTRWVLEVRAFDDGVAFRYRVPGSGRREVQGEATTWALPAGSVAWYQTDTRNYEGEYHSAAPEQIPLTATANGKTNPVLLGPPVTIQLAQGGYLLLSEANLFRYSGFTFRPTGTRTLGMVFEDDPKGFNLEGEIVTPWRVTVVAPDLQTLVNTDVIYSLCDAPNRRLFPKGMQTDWIKPGRALITWCVFGNDGAQWHRQKWFVDKCAALGIEYLLVDGGWRTERWGFRSGGADEWARLRELCEYAAERKVGIVVWNPFPEGRDDGPGLTDPQSRREFMRRCREAGVKGVKIDFFDSESHATLAAQEDLLRLSAENRLMINFHGAHKTTGEVRTWPHQVTQEGIREQEYLLWGELPLEHCAALPFTRMAVGHADFLPAYVRKQYLKNTTAVFQIATAVIATSSFVCWPDHPDDYLSSPFLGFLRELPVVWDETRVLRGSEIGRLAVFARRSGDAWFVGVINGENRAKAWSASLDFLGEGTYDATLYRDQAPSPQGVSVTDRQAVRRGDSLTAELSPGGGFVALIKPRR